MIGFGSSVRMRWVNPLPSIVRTLAPNSVELQKLPGTAHVCSPEEDDCLIFHVLTDITDYFIRIMAAQINTAFTSLHEKLQDQTIKEALKVDTIIKDFDVAETPDGKSAADILNNIALGRSRNWEETNSALIYHQDPPYCLQSAV